MHYFSAIIRFFVVPLQSDRQSPSSIKVYTVAVSSWGAATFFNRDNLADVRYSLPLHQIFLSNIFSY